MPRRINTGHGMVVLPINQLFRLGEGYEVIHGCGVQFANNSQEIEIRVREGRIRHDGQEVEVESQTFTIQPGDPQHPRRDVVWINRFGSARVMAGEARQPIPDDRNRQEVWVPSPPDAAGLDGVVLAEIWVPSDVESSDELNTARDIMDRRMGGSVYSAFIPEMDENPDRDELFQSRMWINRSAANGDGKLMYYNNHADEIRSLEPTDSNDDIEEPPDESFPEPPEVVVEDFTETVEVSWVNGDSDLTYRNPSLVGNQAGYGGERYRVHKYSLPGDGLDKYPDIDHRISVAMRYEDVDSDWGELGFAKEYDGRSQHYTARLSYRDDEVSLVKIGDLIPDETVLGSAPVNLSTHEWYIVDVEYDGGGEGIHTVTVYSVDETQDDPRDTVLAEITNPTSDTQFRGRGVTFRTQDGTVGLDRLTVTEPSDQ